MATSQQQNSRIITKSVFKKRLNRFLDSSRPSKVAIRKTLNHLASNLPNSVVFGGMLRDLALVGAAGFSSDIDIVTDSPAIELERTIAGFAPQRNRFGGYRFVVQGCSFDIWQLRETWAAKEKLLVVESFEDLLATTFFNFDAIAYHFSTKKILVRQDYFASLESSVLDINFQENPNPSGMAARALRLVQFKDIQLSRRLCLYVEQYADLSSLGHASLTTFSAVEKYLKSGERGSFRFFPQVSLC